uniref:Protein kinase domain-containing protein n=1 Tax=Caenorhabditis tropicalis TaxID=1561998 RepID=A0A1I7TEK3_9PELO
MLCYYQKGNSDLQDGCRIVTPIRRNFWELEHELITIEKKLGEGAFGEVSSGTMRFKKCSKTVQVAVKQAKLEKLGKEQIKDFMAEARTMRKLGHQNVVKFYGVAVMQEPLYLVMELASAGALDSYLRKNMELSVEKKTEMLLQAAWGLEYIHNKPMLHRDIAARNCLYGDNKVKISDFGLTRNGTIYQMKPKTKAPIKWLAIESFKTMVNELNEVIQNSILQISSQKTDIWAYGILCWEIFNNGADPYPGMNTSDVAAQVSSGYRMPPYQNAHPEIQTLMTKCCAENPNDRPTMAEIAHLIQRVTGIPRPNFAAIAKKEAEELLLMNFATQKTQRRNRTNRKTMVPKGM